MTEKQAREKVVGIMTGWLGWSEADGKHKKIIDIYNGQKPLPVGYKVKYTDDWCATGVTSAFIAAGMPEIHCPECSCPRMIEKYKKAGRWMEADNYVPKPGDLIMYDWEDKGTGDNTGNPNHVGMVHQVKGNSISVVECNKGDKVAYRTMKVDGKYIRGYCMPDFGKVATKAATTTTSASTCTITMSVLKKGNNGAQVKAAQALLVNAGYGVGSSGCDGSFGAATESAVKKLQTANKLDADGIIGKQTWPVLLGM